MEKLGEKQNVAKILTLLGDMIDVLIKIVDGVEIKNCLCGNYTQKKIMEQAIVGDFGESFKNLDFYIDRIFLKIYKKLEEKIFDIVPEIFVGVDVNVDAELNDFDQVDFFIEEYGDLLESIKGIGIRDIIDLRMFLKKLYHLSNLNVYEFSVPLYERQRRYSEKQLGKNLNQ